MEIILKNASFSIGILPDCGGSLSFFKWKEKDILRPCSAQETEANNSALFVMAPYSSFIANNCFTYFGITRKLSANSPVSKWAFHGDIWRSKAQVLLQSETQVQLKFIHTKETGFPFPYTFYLTYTLDEQGLRITFKLENNSALPLPYGFGVHPFFLKDKTTKIQYESSYLWYRGGDPIFGRPYIVPKEFDFHEKKSLPQENIDIGVSGWNGTATLDTQDYTVQIHTEGDFRHLILFSPKNKNFCCIEPTTHTPDAFNLAAKGIVGTGIQSLGPHETTQTIVQLYVKGQE